MAAQIEMAAFYRVLSTFSTFDGHAYVSRLNPLAEEPGCLRCHVAGASPAMAQLGLSQVICKDGWRVHMLQGLPLISGFFAAICFGVQVSVTAHREVALPAGPSSASPFLGLHEQDLSSKRIHIQATLACLCQKHLSQSLPYKFRQRRWRSNVA